MVRAARLKPPRVPTRPLSARAHPHNRDRENAPVETVLSRRALGLVTLARQLLIDRSERGVVETVEHVVGLQAQVPAVPYLALWSRIAGFTPDDLASAMLD